MENFLKALQTEEYPGVWRIVYGSPPAQTPHSLLGGSVRSKSLHRQRSAPFPMPEGPPLCCKNKSRLAITLPFAVDERIYGFGLQLHSFLQNGTRKTLRTNADPIADTGDSHAPVPFYVSSKGYGLLVDTARNVEFDVGATRKVAAPNVSGLAYDPKTDPEALYRQEQRSGEITISLLEEGITLYLFGGDNLLNIVERYNLFCGGGCLPPIWGLGNLYRCYGKASQSDVRDLIDSFVQEKMPFSMIGLEPGWQSHSYSCSYKWNRDIFPNPDSLIEKARDCGMKMNLWEQAYVHPTAECYESLRPYSGSHEVWQGLAPDFTIPEANLIFGLQQEKLIQGGISAVKLDECDGSDYTGSWFFPDYAIFPSELDGEEMKNLYGALSMRSIYTQYEKNNLRTFSQVRANWSYASPMPFVLYSDLYGFDEFIRGMCNMGFSGLLWSPEVRQCESGEELLRRMQAVVFSPLSLINAWMIPNPPWKQFDIDKNRQNERLADAGLQDACRELLELRNKLIPYLYAAFYRYYQHGTPPFRPLVLDYPEDEKVFSIDDAYMMGSDLLVAPIAPNKDIRRVYLPEGGWYCFWSGKRYEGKQHIDWCGKEIPVFVKEGAILPLAISNPTLNADMVFHLAITLYGAQPRETFLVEDDGETFIYRTQSPQICKLTVKDGKLEVSETQRYIIREQHWIIDKM